MRMPKIRLKLDKKISFINKPTQLMLNQFKIMKNFMELDVYTQQMENDELNGSPGVLVQMEKIGNRIISCTFVYIKEIRAMRRKFLRFFEFCCDNLIQHDTLGVFASFCENVSARNNFRPIMFHSIKVISPYKLSVTYSSYCDNYILFQKLLHV